MIPRKGRDLVFWRKLRDWREDSFKNINQLNFWQYLLVNCVVILSWYRDGTWKTKHGYIFRKKKSEQMHLTSHPVKQKCSSLQRGRLDNTCCFSINIRPRFPTCPPCFSVTSLKISQVYSALLCKHLRSVLVFAKLLFGMLFWLPEPQFPILDNRACNSHLVRNAFS